MPGVETRDYNGPGDWSLDGIRRRYRKHASLGVSVVSELIPEERSEGGVHWIFPVMAAVIDGIERHDAACIELGVEFIESGHKQPFGRILHSNTARALRRVPLTPNQTVRLRARVLDMLVQGQVPHEFKPYAKLLRRISIGDAWVDVRSRLDRANPYVMKYLPYFDACARDESRKAP